ncbi:type II toxin-antitoxin system VapC family toxin (plasmid) [Methylocaldum gracile subsp. desertum]|uniref:type II toxin-antitoxin system VapC family toxin n=1 Tax=Methylocaldum sp. GT1BW TaxID=3438964 RepID=UPI003D9FBA93
MILVDTSIWIDHLRSSNAHLTGLLERDVAAIHNFVIGEIACGNLKNRQEILSLLDSLPKCEPATHEEVLFFIEGHRLMGRGIGYVDACLLAAATLTSAQLWTGDKRLVAIAEDMGCAYQPKVEQAGRKQ